MLCSCTSAAACVQLLVELTLFFRGVLFSLNYLAFNEQSSLMRLCPGSEYFVLESDGILRCGFRQIKIFAIVILRNPVVAQDLPGQSIVQTE